MVRPVSRAVHRHTGQGGKQLPDRPRTHRMSLRRQLGRQRASGLRPPQRRHRITPGIGIHHGLQGRQQTRIRCGQRLTTASTPGRRTRPIGAAPDAKSRRPVATVSGDTPAARATSVTPPRPNSRASAPSTSLPLIQMRPQRGRLTRHRLRAHRPHHERRSQIRVSTAKSYAICSRVLTTYRWRQPARSNAWIRSTRCFGQPKNCQRQPPGVSPFRRGEFSRARRGTARPRSSTSGPGP